MEERIEFPDDSIAITILYDNNLYDHELKTAWGFSCLVKLPYKTILFDTGGDSSILLSNMAKLDVDPQEVNAVFLSHIHGDHIGGLAGFLKRNNKVTVYLPKSFPQSIKAEIRSFSAKIEEVDRPKKLFENVYTTGELGTGIIEQAFIIKTPQGLLVITGCAHPGVLTVIQKAMEITGDKVYLLLGGFHLMGASFPRIESIIKEVLRLGVKKVGPCHCTGDEAKEIFKGQYGSHYLACGVGRKILIHRACYQK